MSESGAEAQTDAPADDPRDPTVPPRAAAILGYAGVIPFVAMTVIIFFRYPREEAMLVLDAQIAYGAVILSFLGGIRWALAMLFPEDDDLFRRLLASVAPSLIGWGAVFMPPAWGLLVLIGGFWGQAASDIRATKDKRAPQWYGGYRLRLTILVVASLAVTLLGMGLSA